MQLSSVNSKLMLGFSSLALLALLSATVLYVVEHTEQQLALEDSLAYATIISDVQSYYSKEIVSHAKKQKIKIAKNFKEEGVAIPYPATFTHNLIAQLNAKYKDLNIHFYSNYPFYNRYGGGARDNFEREALEYLKTKKANSMHRIETVNNQQVFRYAKAIWMEENCVSCHNTHPDSPYKNWKVGDLRGAHSITIKLSGFSLMKNQELNPLIIIIVALYFLMGVFIFMLFFTIKKLVNERKQKQIIRDQNLELKSAKDKIEQWANFDMVTNLPNRGSFYSFVDGCISTTSEDSNNFCLMIIDLDHFKNINDRYGHTVGDALLRKVGSKLKSFTREGDLTARLSGDEFAIYFDDLTKITDIKEIADNIIESFEEPIEAENIMISANISIGVSRHPFDGATTDMLLSNAGLALNKAKSSGRQKCWFFDMEIQRKVRRDDILEGDLKSALTENALDIFYQPKVNLHTGEIDGFEALIRWPHADQGFIAPDEFLPIAEERGLIIPVSRYVAERVAYDIATWLDKKILKGRIAVNVHAHQLKSLEEMEILIDIFDRHDIPPQYLTLEITEGCVIGRGTENTVEILEQLSEKGIKVSLDDFGTGYASLTHLKNLPVQEVKIDKSFLKDITTNRESEAIVSAIIELSKKIGLQIVAEGIETQEQLQKLIDMDCDVGQGFLFAPPSMMTVANGLLTLPNLFKKTIKPNPDQPRFDYNQMVQSAQEG